MRWLSALIFFAFFASSAAYAQTVPLDQKEWYSKSTRGQTPPTWPFGGGAPAESYVENIGFLDSAGNACMPRADANCYPIMSLAPGTIMETRIRDGNGNTLADVVASDGSDFNDSFLALLAKSIGYAWDATNSVWRPVNTVTPSSSSIPTSSGLWFILTKNLIYGLSLSTNEWFPVNVETVGDNIGTRNGIVANSVLYTYDPGSAVYTYGISYTPSGSAASSYRGLVTSSQNLVYNSGMSKWYPMASNTNGEVYTQKRGTNTYSPTKETTSNIAGSAVVVLASKEIIGYPNWCIYLANNDNTDPLTDVDVQVSPDDFATASSTIDLAEPVACDTLAAGAGCVSCYSGSSFRYVRVRATANAVNIVSSLDAWITANVN